MERHTHCIQFQEINKHPGEEIYSQRMVLREGKLKWGGGGGRNKNIGYSRKAQKLEFILPPRKLWL